LLAMLVLVVVVVVVLVLIEVVLKVRQPRLMTVLFKVLLAIALLLLKMVVRLCLLEDTRPVLTLKGLENRGE